jgi:hypothetical protein
MDTEFGVGLPALCFNGGSPMSLVVRFEADVVSSDCIIDSTSSIHMRMFSGLISGREMVGVKLHTYT